VWRVSADLSTERPRLRAGRVALAVVVGALVAGGVGALIARAAGFAAVRHELARADAAWFPVCVVAALVGLAGYAGVFREGFRWRDGPDPGAGLAAAVMLVSIGATRVVVAGGAGALAVTFWCFRRAAFSTQEALVRVLGLNTLFYVTFGLGAWVSALIVAFGLGGGASLALTLPWLAVVPFCFLAASVVTDPARRGRLTCVEGSFPRQALAYAIAGAGWVRDVLPTALGARALGHSALYWGGNVVCLWAALHSIGASLPLPALVLAFATGHVATVLPLPLGGVGGVDAALTYTLTAFGVALAPALVAVAVFRLFSFWLPTIPAVVALLLLPRIGRRLVVASA
jgi:uncharacterized membrane protein YbhN (UPF0104 family)